MKYKSGLLDSEDHTSRNRKRRRQWLLLSRLEWLLKSHTWQSEYFPWLQHSGAMLSRNRELFITLSSKIWYSRLCTQIFQQNAKSASPVQFIIPLYFVGSQCKGNTPALWLENTAFHILLYSHGFCLVLQGLPLQCLTWQSITSEVIISWMMCLERNEPESFAQNFSIFHHTWSHRHGCILISFVFLFLQEVSKGFNFLKPQWAVQTNQCFRGALHCCHIAATFHTRPGKKSDKFVITAYEFPC